VFAGVLSNTASEAGYVILVPLAGVIFLALGRHPLAGMAAAFAGVSGGYSANLLIGTVDPLLSGITQEAAQLIDPDYTVHPLVNWYFMIVSTFLVTGVGTWVTVKIVEPKLGEYDPSRAEKGAADNRTLSRCRARRSGPAGPPASRRVVIALILLATVPEWGVLRNPETGDLLDSPFLRGVVALIFVFFLVPGIAYGVVTGTFKQRPRRDRRHGQRHVTLGLYIVLVFFAAQFVAFFGWTNLGAIVAVTGAGALDALGFTGPLLFVPFILVCAFINLMLGSASAQWAVTAPIFVPMLMLLGYSPEVIQAAYRIGDSTTNIITPMMSYFGLILAFAARYDREPRHRHHRRHHAAVHALLPRRLDHAVPGLGVRARHAGRAERRPEPTRARPMPLPLARARARDPCPIRYAPLITVIGSVAVARRAGRSVAARVTSSTTAAVAR
jgi:aminobenzoyl-glutamate transport protein